MATASILIVEDDGLLALTLEDMIADLGFATAFTAHSVDDALRWLEAGGAADAALLDVGLRGETVYPVAEALAARGVPFAFTTGYGEASDTRCRDRPVLAKPIRQADLQRARAALTGR